MLDAGRDLDRIAAGGMDDIALDAVGKQQEETLRRVSAWPTGSKRANTGIDAPVPVGRTVRP